MEAALQEKKKQEAREKLARKRKVQRAERASLRRFVEGETAFLESLPAIKQIKKNKDKPMDQAEAEDDS